MLAPQSCGATSLPFTLHSRVNRAMTVLQNVTRMLSFVCQRRFGRIAVVSGLRSAMGRRAYLRRYACLLKQAGIAQLSASFRAMQCIKVESLEIVGGS